MGDVTKTVNGESYGPGDFLVVEDESAPSSWHLQVKRHGNPDHGLMGAAWAALHKGHRGNQYEGPNKEEAIGSLEALYKSESMETPKVEAAELTELSFDAIRSIVQNALTKKYPPKTGDACVPCDPWIKDIYADRVIFTKDGVLYRAQFTIDDQEATLGEPEEVTEEYVPSGKTLSEVRDGLIKIPVAYTGSFEKVEGGVLKKFTISASDLRQMAERLSRRETPIDYGHNSAKVVPPGWDKAAGWFAPLLGEVESFGTDPDGKPREILYAWAEFTPACLSMIAAKEYRYFSPEPHWNDKDEHGKPIGTHMAAGAITNRPFLKDLPPIEISAVDYPQLLQTVALSESKRMLTTTSSTAHVNDFAKTTQESTTMKKFKTKKLADGEFKGQTGCFDESGEMVGLAERDGGKAQKLSLRLLKEGDNAGKVGIFEGDDMVGLADHRSMKTSYRALVEYDPSEGEDDPEEAQRTRDAQMREQQDKSNMACLSELAGAKAGEVVAMSERMVSENRLTLPGLIRAQRITRLIDDNTRNGKILPKQRKDFFILATANYEAAEAFLNAMPRPVVDTTTHGFQGDGQVLDAAKELASRTATYMSEHKEATYAEASMAVLAADPHLKAEHDKQRSRETAAAR